ncbi:hypothetical protein AB6A40_001422 [Gnathostoma spinigerum]|uniref:Tr-type G domain-containing protein n=1 Tax=Gnathostoma spinigerum TaxID=75299 RepID=A0ABD6ED03_9BILA
MSRHRNFRNMNYEDERDDEDDEEFHRISISTDDDIPMSPGTAQFMYYRQKVSLSSDAVDGAKVSDFVPEEGGDMSLLENDVIEDENQFRLDDVCFKDVPAPRLKPSQWSRSPAVSRRTPDPEQCSTEVTTLRKQQDASLNTRSTPKRSGKAVLPEVENLKLSEKKERYGDSSSRGGNIPSNSSSLRLSALAQAQTTPAPAPRIRQRGQSTKPLINLVIVGHVDAGKSTLMGHLLYLLGCVDSRTMHKYKVNSARTGKASFAFAWVLDDTEEERERGVTMDIARTAFNTEHRRICVLDAPGHKDFIPNMITGAAQADAALLVVNATRGEFETGFDQGGQTREHAVLLRSLGVSQLIAVVNKMDTVDWSKQRFDDVCAILKTFLKRQAGFSKVDFVPISGLTGDNLIERPSAGHPLSCWYEGPPLIQFIDQLEPAERNEDKPLRAVINDVFKNSGTSLTLVAKVESGQLANGDKIFIMPRADGVIVKGITMENGVDAEDGICCSGDLATLTLNAVTCVEADSVASGHVLSCGGKDCLIPARRFVVRLVVFNIVVPLMKGTKAELYAHSLCEPCTVLKLRAALHKQTGQVLKLKPRCLSRNTSGIVEIETERVICLEQYSRCKALGRITLRAGGQTLAAGLIEETIYGN